MARLGAVIAELVIPTLLAGEAQQPATLFDHVEFSVPANRPDIIRSIGRGYGTDADYLTARIARDRPDILDRMKQGAYQSMRAAAFVPLRERQQALVLSREPGAYLLSQTKDLVDQASGRGVGVGAEALRERCLPVGVRAHDP